MNRFTLGVVAALSMTIAAAPAFAKKKVKARSQGNYTERPLVTSRGDLDVFVGPLANPKFGTYDETGITMLNVPEGDSIWFFNAGVSYGLVKGLEAGVLLPPMQIAPEADAGGLPLFLTWTSRSDDTDFGARATVQIPLESEEKGGWWRLNPGLHALVRFDGGRVDVGAFFPMTFVTAGDESITLAGLNTPLRVSFDIGKRAFLGVDTGLRKLDFDAENDIFIPLGLFGGYTIKSEGVPLIDLTGSFLWQGFVWANAPDGVEDKVFEDLFTLSFGFNVHFDLSAPSKTKKKQPGPDHVH